MEVVQDLGMFLIVGFACGLAFWHLLNASSEEPVDGFRRETIDDLGLTFSAVAFAFAGPVLTACEMRARGHRMVRLLIALVAGVWAISLGIVLTGAIAALM